MKKFLCLFVALLMVFGCTAFAESAEAPEAAAVTNELDITFRDGVKFGMTQQEVVDNEKETLSVTTFGESQNPHVTDLATGRIDIGGHEAMVQYLLWDAAMYAVMFQFFDDTAYEAAKENFTSQYGEPVAYDSEGLTNWIEGISGNRPAFNGSEYVWTWTNGITLTLAQYDGGSVAVYLKTE